MEGDGVGRSTVRIAARLAAMRGAGLFARLMRTRAARGVVTTLFFAFTGPPSPTGLPVELLGGEDRAFPADALRLAVRAHHDTAEACADRTAHVLFHRDLHERLASGLGRPERIRPARAPLSPQLRDPESPPSARCLRRERGEHGARPAGERLVRPTLALGHEV